MSTRFWSILLLGLLVLPLTTGCFPPAPPDQDDGNNDDAINNLTEVERAAIKAAIQSAGAFSQAVNASHEAAGQQSPSGELKPGDLTGGTCPEVSTQAVLGDPALDVTIDFKNGCTLPFASNYTCSGSASGQLDLAAKELDLDFNSISCSGNTALTGGISVNYALSTNEVSLDGEWDLSYAADGGSITTFGNGTTRYDIADLITTIAEFQGLLAQGDNDWDLTMTNVAVSYAQNQSYLPYSGTMTLSGQSIQQLTIRFNENSPGTGEIEVSIAGGDFFTINVSQL